VAAKKKNLESVRKDIRDATKSAAPPPAFDWKKVVVRGGAVLAAIWALCIALYTFQKSVVWLIVPVVLSGAVAAAYIWMRRMLAKQKALGAILEGADTKEGRADALEKLGRDFKDTDTQAVLAKAQLEAQDDPRKALETLEAVRLDKVMGPMAGQVRAMRAMLHLSLGETDKARHLADALDLGKQQDAKIRAMFATVCGEAWARTGLAQKAKDTLELFDPEDPINSELKAQMWRARAFAYAGTGDTRSMKHALRRLGAVNPYLLGMFVGQKRVHPLLEREAKQMVMSSGVVKKQMQRAR
jgi:hypothetical protein